MKFSVAAFTLFAASASAFSPITGPISRYDDDDLIFDLRKNNVLDDGHCPRTTTYAHLLVIEIARCFTVVWTGRLSVEISQTA